MPFPDQTTCIDEVADAIRERRPLNHGRYRVSIAIDGLDVHPVTLDDPVPLGRQILEAAGKTAVDDFALFAIVANGDFEDVRPDEEVDLLERGTHRFVAFTGDPLYRFKLDDSRIVWGMSTVPETVLRALAGIGDDEGVFLEVRGGADRPIPRGGQADLAGAGVERFVTARLARTYAFFVNGKRYETDREALTGAQIKAMVPGWDQSHDLALEGVGDAPDRIIADDETVSLDPKHGLRRFSSVPKANFG